MKLSRGGVLIAAATLATLVAGCGSSDSTSSPSSAPATAATKSSAPTKTAAEVKGGAVVKAMAGDKPLHVAFFGQCACNAYAASEGKAVETAVKQLGNGSTYTFFDGKFSVSTQVNGIQDAITSKKYNAFVILPISGAAVVPSVRRATQEGIKVGAEAFPIGPSYTETDRAQVPGVLMSLVNNPNDDGSVTAGRANELCEGKDPCNVVVMLGDRTQPSEALRLDAIKKTIKPNVKLVNVCDGKYTQDGGFKCMQDALQVNKDIDVVLTPSGDQMLSGAQKALTAAGTKIGKQNAQGKFKFVGLGASEDAVKQIRAGLWDSSRVWLGGPTISTIMIAALNDHLNGRGDAWPESFPADKISPVGAIANEKSLAADPSFKGEWCC
jgi:ribose transport system substrate-binding protein